MNEKYQATMFLLISREIYLWAGSTGILVASSMAAAIRRAGSGAVARARSIPRNDFIRVFFYDN